MLLYQNGTEAAFRILYERHSRKIYGFILKKVRKEEQAMDIFQEVFIKMHKSKHLYNKTLPALPWIFTITSTSIIDFLRKNKNDKNWTDQDLDLIASPEVQIKNEVGQYLDKLPIAQKEILQMRYLEEKTFEEMAQKLKTSENNVRQMVSRGVKRLKEAVGENHE